MSTQITVTLPDDIYQHVRDAAESSGKEISEIVAQQLKQGLALLGKLPPVSSLSDKEVMALAEAWMDARAARRQRALLDKQLTGSLSEPEQLELAGLWHVYQQGWLRKAQAQVEAVRRGLLDSGEA